MPDLNVDADLIVDDGAGGERQLSVEDFKAALTGDATETTLALVKAAIDALAAEDFATEATLTARLPQDASGGVEVRDVYTAHRVTPSQNGANGVLDFDLGADCDLIWVKSVGGDSFAAVGSVPANGTGAPCEDGLPQPLTVRSQTVKVWAPAGTTVHVWGFGS